MGIFSNVCSHSTGETAMLVHDVGDRGGEVVNSERCEGMCWNTVHPWWISQRKEATAPASTPNSAYPRLETCPLSLDGLKR
jgi:hypothetical protein